MMPRLLPGDDRKARQVITKAESHGGGHGKNKRMLMIGSAGEDNQEELVKEEADAVAEGRVVLGAKMRLVQGNQAKDPCP